MPVAARTAPGTRRKEIRNTTMTAFGRGLRRLLDGLYFTGGVFAALCLISILAIIVAQMIARWTGLTFPGATSYAGYAMASASFFAFAHALNRGAHIRVSILLSALGERRRWLEVWCFAIGSALAGYLAYYAIKAVYWSRKLNDISQGQDATPLWIPQMAMAAGAVLLAIAMADHLVRVLFLGDPGIRSDTVEQSHGE
jgi:TRAP-type C4-dicarboxylate transport system permease small subunit